MSNKPRLAALSPRAIDEGAVFADTDFGCRSCELWSYGFAGVVVVLGVELSPLLVLVCRSDTAWFLRLGCCGFCAWVGTVGAGGFWGWVGVSGAGGFVAGKCSKQTKPVGNCVKVLQKLSDLVPAIVPRS